VRGIFETLEARLVEMREEAPAAPQAGEAAPADEDPAEE
jgi:hypothetical protein